MLRVLRSRFRHCCLKYIGKGDGYIVRILAGDETACTRYRLQTFYLISVLISHVAPAGTRRDIDFMVRHSNAGASDLDRPAAGQQRSR